LSAQAVTGCSVNGPEASAGLNPSRLIKIGVIVPTNDEKHHDTKSANDTMIESLCYWRTVRLGEYN